jgi:hypothetical protein
MPSTYTSNSGIELIDNGEQSGTWGDTTNTNLQIIDRLTNGVGNITLSGTTHTLTTSDGTLSDGHYKVLVFGGSPSGTNTVTVSPNDQDKLFFIKNSSGQSVIISQGSGANVTVPNGESAVIYCDGAGSGAAVVNLSATFDLTTFLTAANNLSDLASAVTALTNLGLTATAAEINVLDGITADTAELNIMDGVTSTTAELNILDGVTSTTAELNILDGVTATTAELNYNDITTLGTSQASKVVTADASNVITITGQTADSVGTVSSGVVDLSTGNFFSDAPSANTTYSFTNPIASGSVSAFVLKVTPSALISLTWPASVVWNNGSAPNTTGSGEVDVFVFYTPDGGTTYYGFQAGDDMS